MQTDRRKRMSRLICTLMLIGAAREVSAQISLGDAARRAEEQRNALPPAQQTFGAKHLPGPARIDAILGDFVLTLNLVYSYRRAELGIVKARNDRALDTWLMKWEHETRHDPFAMEQPYRKNPHLMRVFDSNDITPRDYIFIEQALGRARSDKGESKAARALLPRPRRINLEFVDKHEGNLGPAWELEREQRILEIRRSSKPRP
jgi:hypothetical protein